MQFLNRTLGFHMKYTPIQCNERRLALSVRRWIDPATYHCRDRDNTMLWLLSEFHTSVICSFLVFFIAQLLFMLHIVDNSNLRLFSYLLVTIVLKTPIYQEVRLLNCKLWFQFCRISMHIFIIKWSPSMRSKLSRKASWSWSCRDERVRRWT